MAQTRGSDAAARRSLSQLFASRQATDRLGEAPMPGRGSSVCWSGLGDVSMSVLRERGGICSLKAVAHHDRRAVGVLYIHGWHQKAPHRRWQTNHREPRPWEPHKDHPISPPLANLRPAR